MCELSAVASVSCVFLQVTVRLIGSEGESELHNLTDPDKPVFERGAVDMFLLATPFPLGKLQNLRLQHDNSGGHPSWYWKQSMSIVRTTTIPIPLLKRTKIIIISTVSIYTHHPSLETKALSMKKGHVFFLVSRKLTSALPLLEYKILHGIHSRY